MTPRHRHPPGAGGASASALAPALAGERFTVDGLSCYVAGEGPPLLLLHSVNAAGSAAEMRPLFDRYRATRTVFAMDLPGFGFSERSDRPYSPRLMTDAVHTMAAEIRRGCGNASIAGLALSLGAEFLARAAVERPTQWDRLALVSPTGLDGRKSRRGPEGSTRRIPGLHALLSVPLWSDPLFRLLTRPAVVRYFLERTWGSEAIDEALWAYDVHSARQPGARFAPLHFLSGGLFSGDIHRVYERLTQPVWMSHGMHGDFNDYRNQEVVESRPNWRFGVFQTGALPYFETPDEFFAGFDAFLGKSIHA
ncbi:MAG: alpha/beta hydrolase [Pseudomonadota bacterium]|nr:alpha/beta hydrolase [Pseudomonadota bacterium]